MGNYTDSLSGHGAPFKVIIVGAGVAGLTLAHCLEKANIDYVVFDKGLVGPPLGTTITIQPHGCRILHQLGCLDAILTHCSTMEGWSCRSSSGKIYARNNFFGIVREYAGYDTRTVTRRTFLRTLYDLLPDKTKVVEHCHVRDIIEEKGAVRVLLEDGTEHVGDLVVGADGVHSKVREILWKNANRSIPGLISAAEKRSMATSYNALVAMCPPIPGLGQHDMEITSDDGFSFLLLCQPTYISFIVHCKLPKEKQYRWPNRAKYTEEEMETLAARFADHPIAETVLFGELWRSRTWGQLIALEEGVLDHWFFGRIALAGDAIHKVTPNSGLGGCTAMEGVVSIANAIHGVVNAHPDKKPSDIEIRNALQHYQDSRLQRVKEIVRTGGFLTRLQAYDSWFMYFLQRWMTPLVGLDIPAKRVARLCTEAPKLTYVPFDEQRGKLGWRDETKMPLQRQSKIMRTDQASGKSLSILVGTLIILLLTFWSIALKSASKA